MAAGPTEALSERSIFQHCCEVGAKSLDVAVTAVAKVPSDCPLVDPRVRFE